MFTANSDFRSHPEVLLKVFTVSVCCQKFGLLKSLSVFKASNFGDLVAYRVRFSLPQAYRLLCQITMNYSSFVNRLDNCHDLADDASSKGKTWSVRQEAFQNAVHRIADRIKDKCDFFAMIDHINQLYYAFSRRKRP